jgi:hypothetical protein
VCTTRMRILLILASTVCVTQAFDKYQDALEKYRRWQERYASIGSTENFIRVQRQTKRKPATTLNDQQRDRIDDLVLKNVIPQDDEYVTNFAKSSNLEPFNNVIEESEVNLLRPVRTPAPILYTQGGPGSEYIHSSGVPLYKIRNRYPHGYGRKKRSAHPQGWTILDPLTGRPKDVSIEIPAVSRRERQPVVDTEAVIEGDDDVASLISEAAAGSEYIHSSGQPLYKYRNRYPHGYGRKKRSANPQGWTLLDPLTGRPKDTSLEIPAVLRRERQPLDEGLHTPLADLISRQLTSPNPSQQAYRYKYYKNHPYTG